jgi:hypothetical protein
MAKINSMTPEQMQAMIAYRAEWIRNGESTERNDPAQIREAVASIYATANLSVPSVIVMDSPLGCLIARAIVMNMANLGANLWANLGDNLGDNLRANLGGNLRDNLRDNLRANLGDNLRANLRDNLGDNLRDNLGANLWDNLGANLDWNFWGQHEIYWPAFYAWPHEQLRQIHAKDEAQKLSWWMILGRSCGWWQPFKGVVIACERPSVVLVNDAGRLHCDDGPAYLCRDTWPLWSIGGVFVDEQIVMRPKSQTVEQIREEKSEEIKRIRIERFGWQQYLSATHATVVDRRRNDVEATKEALMRTPDGMTVLVCHCPSTARVYALEVDPKCQTAEQAQNYLWSGSKTRELSKQFNIIGRS